STFQTSPPEPLPRSAGFSDYQRVLSPIPGNREKKDYVVETNQLAERDNCFAGDRSGWQRLRNHVANCSFLQTAQAADDYRKRSDEVDESTFMHKFNHGFDLSDDVANSVPFVIVAVCLRALCGGGNSWKP